MIPLLQYKDKHIAVFGLGKSGMATYNALRASGADVVAWDDKAASKDGLVLIPYQEWNWEKLDALILSPGIPLYFPEPHPVVKLARKHHVRITCDVSLLMEAQKDATFIGITGTNGKSTTTALIAHCLETLGATIQCGGNIGTPVLAMDALGKGGIYVLELSSYQLDLMDVGAVNIACLLNITPDHLDRHGGMDGYVVAKERIFARQSHDDVAIIAVDDEYCKKLAMQHDALTVSTRPSPSCAYDISDGGLRDGAKHYPLTNMPSLQGAHNHQNALVAYGACRAAGYDGDRIIAAMQSFGGLAHRMERVGEMGGVLFINDSKATNADAAAKSLGTYENIYWILGGVAKAGGIESLTPYFGRVRHAYCIGEEVQPFTEVLEKQLPYTVSLTLEQAVEAAFEAARHDKKAVILFAPAAASFDQFANFEVRGDSFKQLVKKLK